MPDIEHRFVRTVPTVLAPNTLYVSRKYGLAVHLCMCGCRTKVVTPLGPAEWSVRLEANTITLRPSVGNGGFPCKSHYLITRSIVHWLPRLTTGQQQRAWARDAHDLDADIRRGRPWWRSWRPSGWPSNRAGSQSWRGTLKRRWDTIGIRAFTDPPHPDRASLAHSVPLFLLVPAAMRALALRVVTTSVAFAWVLSGAATFWWSATDPSGAPSWMPPVVVVLTLALALLVGVDQAVRPTRRPFSLDTRRW